MWLVVCGGLILLIVGLVVSCLDLLTWCGLWCLLSGLRLIVFGFVA